MAEQASSGRVWLALWAVYILWGSTYLAIRVAVHPSHGAPIPPLILAGTRFVLAGLLMLAFTARRPAPDGQPDPLGWTQWGAAAVIGLALPFGGNGLVSVAEKRIPSGVAAVVVATVPIWAALFAAAVGRERVTRFHFAGLVLGFAGVAALVIGSGSGRASTSGVAIVVVAAISWAAGSVWSQTAPTARRPLVTTGMEMLCGGIGCLVTAAITGEFSDLKAGSINYRGWLAFAYLVLAGSMVAYSAYVWLLRNVRLSLVTTYAFVNPVVAVALGAIFLSESFTIRSAGATLAVVLGVILMLRRPQPAEIVE
ncbi:MAG TPA: EamA family transporter [Mycobacteriales bacterium]|jgi:drug/metabolite transporter (DMT)-like permease|nr:EamA family transporter [Mycobacteriales bacterium]